LELYIIEKGGKVLTNGGANPQRVQMEQPKEVVFFAVESGELELLQALIVHNPGHYINAEDYPLILLCAVQHGHLDMVKWLVGEGFVSIVHLDERECTILHHAAMCGHLHIVQWLQNMISVHETTVDKYTALLCAARFGHLAVVQWLVLHGGSFLGDQDSKGCGALHLAASTGALDVVQWLVRETKADVSSRSTNGFSPLLYAASLCTDTTRWLLTEGAACISDVGINGTTVLQLAASHMRLDDVQWLVREAGASMTASDRDGLTPIRCATLRDQVSIVEWLLLNGVVEPAIWSDMITLRRNRWQYWICILVLFCAPPSRMAAMWSPRQLHVIRQGARVRERLPYFQDTRRVIVSDTCSLPTSVSSLVLEYAEFSSACEMWCV